MAYDTVLAERLRQRLETVPGITITEKAMFGGLAFMVNGKMCINVSDDNLMCRYDPALQEKVAERNGYLPMIMRGKHLEGYCYVEPEGFRSKKDFEYWVKICLDYNPEAKASKK